MQVKPCPTQKVFYQTKFNQMTTRRITCPVCDDYYSWCKITKVGVHIFRAATEEKRKKLKNKPHCDYLKEHAKKKTILTLQHLNPKHER